MALAVIVLADSSSVPAALMVIPAGEFTVTAPLSLIVTVGLCEEGEQPLLGGRQARGRPVVGAGEVPDAFGNNRLRINFCLSFCQKIDKI